MSNEPGQMSEQERNEAIAVELMGWRKKTSLKPAIPINGELIDWYWEDADGGVWGHSDFGDFHTYDGMGLVIEAMAAKGLRVHVEFGGEMCHAEVWKPNAVGHQWTRLSDVRHACSFTAVLTAALKAIRSTA